MRKQLKAKNSCKNQSEKKDREISSPRDENITTLRKEDESRKSKRRKKIVQNFERASLHDHMFKFFVTLTQKFEFCRTLLPSF